MTYNTGNPIGSTDARDRSDNSENMDILENSTTLNEHPDRLGTMRKTRKGMELEHDNQISAHEAEHDNQMQYFEDDFDSRLAGMAFTRVGTFTAGATLTDMRQTMLWEVSQGGDGHEYGWSGSFPQVVSAGATPATSGGVGAGAWVDRTDVTLRDEVRETTFQTMKRSYAEAGFNLVDGSFQMGGSLSGWPDVLWDWATGVAYQWHLDEAKTIPSGSTPETSGGVGAGAWVDRTQDTLRSELQSSNGATLVNEQFFGGTVADFVSGKTGFLANFNSLRSFEPTVNGQIVRIKGHTSTGIGGGEFYYDDADTTSSDDNGWTAVTAGGKRWKRKNQNKSILYLDDFGLLESGSLDAPLQNAYNTAVLYGVSKIVIPSVKNVMNRYVLSGGLSFTIPNSDIEITSMCAGLNGIAVDHTSNNVGITFVKGTSLFARARISGFTVYGSGNSAHTSAAFAEFQDTWGCGASHMMVRGYAGGAAFNLHNKTGWTERAYFEDVMTRGCLKTFKFKRTQASGGTNSFFAFTTRSCWHQFALSGSSALDISSDATGGLVTVYGANIEIGGWFESGAANQIVSVGDYGELIDSHVDCRLDGCAGFTSDGDFVAIRQRGTGLVDVTAKYYNQQGGLYDVSAKSTGSNLTQWIYAVRQETLSSNTNGRPLARVRGARMRWQHTGTTDKTFTITNLQSYNSYKATLTVKGTNIEFAETYQIDVGSSNFYARVRSLSSSDGAGVNSNFRLRVYGGNTGGGFLAGGGNKFDWQLLAATAGGTSFTASLELEMI